MRKKPDKPPEAAIQATKERGLELLMLGMGRTEVARELKVDRSTVWKWMHDPTFAARLKETQQQSRERARVRVNELAMHALDACERCLDDEDGRVAMAAAKVILDRVDPVGSASEQAREMLQAYLVGIVAHLAGDLSAQTFTETRESLGRFVQHGGVAKALPQGLSVKVETVDATKGAA